MRDYGDHNRLTAEREGDQGRSGLGGYAMVYLKPACSLHLSSFLLSFIYDNPSPSIAGQSRLYTDPVRNILPTLDTKYINEEERRNEAKARRPK
jgi:hypothetical protein